MGKKHKRKKKFEVDYGCYESDFDEDLLQAYNNGEISEDEVLSDPRMMCSYDSYYSATDEQRKKERKRRKKMAGLNKEQIEDIYEAIGGFAHAKEYAKNLREYAEQVSEWLILMHSPAELVNRCINIVLQGAEDLEEGCPWIFQYDDLMGYSERMATVKR